MVPRSEQVGFLRHKERKFGRGCLEQWKASQKELLANLEQKLVPFEEMLLYKAFLVDERPRFVDFDLYGMLSNFLYSGHYQLPAAHDRLRRWYARLTPIQFKSLPREKELHPRHERSAARSKLPG